MKLIHLTDLHIAPKGNRGSLSHTADRTLRAIQKINAQHGDAELCVVTGDIVYDPDAEAYALAENILSQLTIPTICILGNHDDRGMAQDALPWVGSDENGFAQQVMQLSQCLCVMLDTKAENTHAGALCPTRLAWLDDQLDRNEGPVWLFMHHAPFPTGLKAMDTIGLDPVDAQALKQVLLRHGNVRHIFFGHYHRPMSGQWCGIPFSSHRSMMMQCALDLSAEDFVPAVEEEAQFAVILSAEDHTVVHYDDFDSPRPVLNMGAPES